MSSGNQGADCHSVIKSVPRSADMWHNTHGTHVVGRGVPSSHQPRKNDKLQLLHILGSTNDCTIGEAV